MTYEVTKLSKWDNEGCEVKPSYKLLQVSWWLVVRKAYATVGVEHTVPNQEGHHRKRPRAKLFVRPPDLCLCLDHY